MAKIQSVEPNIADLANGWMKSYHLEYKLEQESLNTEISSLNLTMREKLLTKQLKIFLIIKPLTPMLLMVRFIMPMRFFTIPVIPIL